MTTFKKAPLALAITALMATPYALADGIGNGFIGGYNTFDIDSRIDSDFDNRIDVELRHDSDTYKDFYVKVGTFDPARHYSGATVAQGASSVRRSSGRYADASSIRGG